MVIAIRYTVPYGDSKSLDISGDFGVVLLFALRRMRYLLITIGMWRNEIEAAKEVSQEIPLSTF